MQFTDKDICGFTAYDNGVVLKANLPSLPDSADDDDKVAIHLYLNEVNELMDAVNRASPDESAPELPLALNQISTNSPALNMSTVVMNGTAVRNNPTTKRNRAYVFISSETLREIKSKLNEETERRNQIRVFDDAFKAMTRRKPASSWHMKL